MFQVFFSFVLAYWLFRQPGATDTFGLAFLIAGVITGAIAVPLLILLLGVCIVFYTAEFAAWLRFLFGAQLTDAERQDWLNREGWLAMAKDLDEARRWKQIAMREPWKLSGRARDYWMDHSRPGT
jgi:hypothetical protein